MATSIIQRLEDFERRQGRSSAPDPAPAAEDEGGGRSGFAQAFPHLGAFTEGLTGSLTLGAVKPTQQRDFLSTEGAAETVGMIVGEVPFWWVGGRVAKTLITAARGTKAMTTSAAFGKTVKVAEKHGKEVGEAAGALGVTTGRDIMSDDPRDDITPFQVAIDMSLPFASSVVKVGKRFGERKKELANAAKHAARMARAHERRIRNAHAAKSPADIRAERQKDLDVVLGETSVHDARQADLEAAFPSPSTEVSRTVPQTSSLSASELAELKQKDLDAVFDAMDPEDASVVREMEELFTLRSGDEAHIEEILTMYRQGAPLKDLLNLHTKDDIADYLALSRKYPINKPAVQTWEEVAARRKDSDMLMVKELVIGRMRPLKNVQRPVLEGADAVSAARRPASPQDNVAKVTRTIDHSAMPETYMVKCPGGI